MGIELIICTSNGFRDQNGEGMTEGRPGRVALVTGGGRGVGAGIAAELGRQGYRVAVNYLREADSAERVTRGIKGAGGEAIAVQADVRDATESARLVEEVVSAYGRLDALVCNANVGLGAGPVGSVPWEVFSGKVLDELAAAFHPTYAALPVMAGQRYGRIVYVSSEAAKGPAAVGMGAHSAAKAALNAYGRVVARECAPQGVVVNVLSCGFVRTDATAVVSEDRVRRYAERVPAGRIGEPEDIGRVAAFLCGDGAGFMIGAVTPVDGGAGIPVH
jgi:3-oxoacyl-[acyl-carrier protein] reductase